MAGTYAAEHADALADIREAGADVSFSRTSTVRDAATATVLSTSVATVTGAAIGVKGNPIRLQALGLIESDAPTLLFAPDAYGQVPALESAVTWNGVPYVVKSVDPSVAIDGVFLMGHVVIAR